MKDASKTKQALIQELVTLRRKMAEQERSESAGKQTKGEPPPAEGLTGEEMERLMTPEESTREDMAVAMHKLELEIAKRKGVEEELRESGHRYRLLVENADETIIVIQDGMTKFVNRRAEWTGYSEAEYMSMPFLEFIHPEDRDMVKERYRQKIDGETATTRNVYRTIHKSGRIQWIEVGSVLIDWDGRPATLNFITDITERKHAEEALREQEIKISSIFRAAPVGIGMVINRVLREANDTLCRMTGYSRGELLGQSARILYPSDEDYIYVGQEKYRQMGENLTGTVETRWKRKDGTIMDILLSSTMLDTEDLAKGVTFTALDITARRQAVEALRKSEEKYRSLASAADSMYLVDRECRFLLVNERHLQRLGLPAGQVAGRKHGELHSAEDARIFENYVKQVFETGEALQDEYRSARDGRHFVRTLSPVKDDKGKTSAVTVVAKDITDRKRAEEEKRNLEERLQRAEKMEALGQLAGGVAHDLNNVLGILSGYSELLLDEIPEGHRSRGHVKKILQSTEKGAAIIQDLLTLARRGVTASEVINLNSVVSDFLMSPVFERIKGYHPRVTFRTECDRNLLNIKGSPVHLEKTLMNLVSNAAESISGEGVVTIRTESRYLDKPLRGCDEVKDGEYALLIVSDTGKGIPPEDRERIFEPFYTKKTMGRSGTGLGLAIVWGTVKDHNGYIDVQTEVEEGSTFSLYFQVTREERIVKDQKEPTEHYRGKGESVLVVDDTAEQRDISARLLTRLGYEVHVASSGEEAVEYLKGNKADILVLDMVMTPGIDGLETYERILEDNPKQKALLVSGFSETERVRAAQKRGAGAYVKKPYLMERIGMALRDELGR